MKTEKDKKVEVLSKTSVVFSDTDGLKKYNLRWSQYQLDQDHPLITHLSHYDQKTSPSWDIHTGLEMGVILKGKVNRWHGRFKQTLTKGQVWLCNAWEPHGFCVLKAPVDILVAVFWPAGLAMASAVDNIDYLHPFRLPAPSRPQSQTNAVQQKIIQLARDALASSNTPYGRERQLLLTKLILLELMADGRAPGTTGNLTTSLDRITPALKLVHENPTRRVSLTEAARTCHISPALLVRLFRTMMGVSFADYARRRRLAALATELQSSETKISSLARKYGFIDAPHLTRVFKSAFGITPTEYRQAHPQH
jgi:AraC-like DNA-binding protein/quercetin dioxygenase-like cupin family protein